MRALTLVLLVSGCSGDVVCAIERGCAELDLAGRTDLAAAVPADLAESPDLAWTDLAGGVDIAEAPRDLAKRPDLAWADLAKVDLWDPCNNQCDYSYQKCKNGQCVACGANGTACCDDGIPRDYLPDGGLCAGIQKCIGDKNPDGGVPAGRCYECTGDQPRYCCSSVSSGQCVFEGVSCTVGITCSAP